jgi:hypothetical protein
MDNKGAKTSNFEVNVHRVMLLVMEYCTACRFKLW